jgi:WD40 repeat protein
MAQNRDRWRSTTQSNTAVQGLTFSPDGRWLAATTADERFIRVWEVATGKVVANLVGMGKQLAFSPDGQLLAIGSVGLNGTENRRLELFDMEAKRVVARSGVAHANFIAAIAFAPDGQTIVTGSTDKTIKFWDVPAAPR